ncbi:red pigment-concentrating hormone [Penaeus chinensis]|uniref:red pigment-concentrating hormone n=1 Tax=Penaeus chinensis TaxID=139456 RepID=UPI001FB80FE4|nr:red pigment-concentrating hormone [Penaeus chinensis]
MVRAVVATLLVVLVVASCVSAQLNFSPGWGKRAAAGGEGTGMHPPAGAVLPPPSSLAGESCGTIPVTTVMHIYRLIRAEATRLVQCQDEEYLG